MPWIVESVHSIEVSTGAFKFVVFPGVEIGAGFGRGG